MTKSFSFGLLTASMLALSTSAAFADYQLNILHINDFHSRVEPINKFDSTCSAEEEGKKECFGGAARLKTAIDQRRQALSGQNVLLLNAGDNFQGSLFYTTYKGAVEAEMLNAMKFDVMTVGNHEFDDSEDGLATFLDKVQFPVISANVLAGDSSKLRDRIKPSVVLDVGGQKIGIVGAVTNDTEELSSPGPNVIIADDVQTITAAVQELKAQGVDKIIALTHVGYPRDLSAIAKIPDVDVVVGGHSHSLLSNTDPKAEGPYPTMVDNPGGYKVPVVQAASYSKYLGDLVVDFDDNGVVKSAKGDPILIDSSFTPDPALTTRIAELAKPIEELRKKVIGSSEAPIEGDRTVCRVKECSMGNLVADAMLDRTRNQGMQIAIQNGGGLRASIDGGEITQGEVITVLPFQNTVATFQLTGADIVHALENGVSQIDQGAGRFPQVAGLKYSFDKSKPAGSRISDVRVEEGNTFVPIDPAKTYGVVTNNFMRAGGDGYSIFETAGKNAYDFGPDLADVTVDYLAAHNPYKPYTDGRVTEVSGAMTQAPAAPAPAAPAPAAPAPTQESAPAPAAPSAPQPAPASAAPAPAEPAPAAATPSTHVITTGDTLWDLSEHFYGDGALWKKISEANGNPNPRRLLVGKELQVPAK